MRRSHGQPGPGHEFETADGRWTALARGSRGQASRTRSDEMPAARRSAVLDTIAARDVPLSSLTREDRRRLVRALPSGPSPSWTRAATPSPRRPRVAWTSGKSTPRPWSRDVVLVCFWSARCSTWTAGWGIQFPVGLVERGGCRPGAQLAMTWARGSGALDAGSKIENVLPSGPLRAARASAVGFGNPARDRQAEAGPLPAARRSSCTNDRRSAADRRVGSRDLRRVTRILTSSRSCLMSTATDPPDGVC